MSSVSAKPAAAAAAAVSRADNEPETAHAGVKRKSTEEDEEKATAAASDAATKRAKRAKTSDNVLNVSAYKKKKQTARRDKPAAAAVAVQGAKGGRSVFVVQVGAIDHLTNEYRAISDIEDVHWTKKKALISALEYLAFFWQDNGYPPKDVPLPDGRKDDPVREAFMCFIGQLSEPYESGANERDVDDERLETLSQTLSRCREADLQFWLDTLGLSADGQPWIAVTQSSIPAKP